MSEEEERCICQICQCGNHKCAHVENNWPTTTGIGESTTEYGAQYPGKEAVRTRAIHPAETTLNSGEFHGETTNKADFYEKQFERNRSFKPIVSTIQSGEFNGDTTHKSDFNLKQVRLVLGEVVNSLQNIFVSI
ncbi:unnamed protein product [Strongylus vulgaris]|uniref:Uncharacterized protein n=1 Tax=Strongylus vulgaris TaxID=40348 RepID=A0A3P7KRI6_STRVU|nr:unnamed protein product [Strongylus vulgaris]